MWGLKFGSPTCIRTRDLRINSIGHSKNYPSKVEEFVVIFSWVFSLSRRTEPMPNLFCLVAYGLLPNAIQNIQLQIFQPN